MFYNSRNILLICIIVYYNLLLFTIFYYNLLLFTLIYYNLLLYSTNWNTYRCIMDGAWHPSPYYCLLLFFYYLL